MEDNLTTTQATSDTSGNPASTVQPTPSTASPTGVPAFPATPTQAPATGVAPQVPPGYVPSFRLREQNERAEARYKEFETAKAAEIDRLTRQVQALTGVNPPDTSQEESIRQQLWKVAPDLKELIELKAQLVEMAKSKDDWRQQNEHYWQSYNRTQMDKLFKTASESYGQSLTDPQKRYLAASFVGWAQSDPELVERYQSDPSLIDDFWKEFSSSFIEPARRVATTSATARVAQNLPQDTPAGAVRTTAVNVEQPKDLDARVDNAWQAFKQMRAGKG